LICCCQKKKAPAKEGEEAWLQFRTLKTVVKTSLVVTVIHVPIEDRDWILPAFFPFIQGRTTFSRFLVLRSSFAYGFIRLGEPLPASATALYANEFYNNHEKNNYAYFHLGSP
jgi:hypothetical protein